MNLLRLTKNEISNLLDYANYRFNLPNINVLNKDKTLDLILKENLNIARFGDGEIDLIEGKSIEYQQVNTEISKQLRAILYSNDPKLLICIPDIFSNIQRYTNATQRFWRHDIRIKEKLYKSLAATHHTFGSTQLSRPYINLCNKSSSKEYFSKLKYIWKNKDILIVEGNTSRSGVGNDLFSDASSIKRIICPSKDAFSKIDEIEKSINVYKDNRLILLMLGPTADIIVSDLSSSIKNQIIDLGHIDSEYEWFLRGDLVRKKLPHKHTAEFNSDQDEQNIILENNPEYDSEIVDRID